MKRFNISRYDSYYSAPLKWAPALPSSWGLKKGKRLFRKMERPVLLNAEVITCFRDGQVTLRSKRRTEGFTNAIQEHGYQGIKEGDLIIHGMDAFSGAIGVSDSDGKASPVYSVCVPIDQTTVTTWFYAYLLRNLAHSGYIQSLARGIRERSTDFRYNDFASLMLPIPPLPEQKAIVDFLDEKTSLIDRAISQKERLIELLKERKQIIIQNAVTKGLDPNVKMKDSGVEWIGEIPEHWEVRRIKRIFRLIDDRVPAGSAEELLSLYSDIGVKPRKDLEPRGNKASTTDNYLRVRKGDVVVNILLAWMGAVGFSEYDGITSPAYNILRAPKQVFAPFFHYLFRSKRCQSEFLRYSKGIMAMRWRLYFDDMGVIKVPFPPPPEQEAIVQAIEEHTASINAAINSQQSQIEKLKEYRTILIDAAVTGKIRVTDD